MNPGPDAALCDDPRWSYIFRSREFDVRRRYRSRTEQSCGYQYDLNPRRVVKVMTLQERRAEDAASEECNEIRVHCKLSRFRRGC